MDGYIFERCFVSYVSRLAVEQCGNHSEFARIAFDGVEAPANTWRNIRNGNRGKLRDVTLKDAFNMASSLGMDLETLCWKVRREIEEGWTPEQDVCHQEDGKPGRRKKRAEGAQPPSQSASGKAEKNFCQ